MRANTQRVEIKKGMEFGKLKVIEDLGYDAKAKEHKYRCRCKCGNERIVRKGGLLSGKITKCEACTKRNDYTGQKICGYIVEKQIGITADRKTIWLCRCINCGKTKEVRSDVLKKELIGKCSCRGIKPLSKTYLTQII